MTFKKKKIYKIKRKLSNCRLMSFYEKPWNHKIQFLLICETATVFYRYAKITIFIYSSLYAYWCSAVQRVYIFFVIFLFFVGSRMIIVRLGLLRVGSSCVKTQWPRCSIFSSSSHSLAYDSTPIDRLLDNFALNERLAYILYSVTLRSI